VNLLKNWFPLEVIELTRWNPPTEQTVDSISFCAGLLLLGASNKHVSEYISSINENLIIIIDCNELFDEDFQEILLELINILIKSDRKYHEEETPFLYLAKAIVEIYYQLPHHESMGEYCLSVEHHFEHGLCAVDNPKTIYNLSNFNQRNELWKKHIKKANLSSYHISL
jgi:predicted transcriptional regulator